MPIAFVPQVAVVDFHHARGPEVEFWVQQTGTDLSNGSDWSLLPFLALADGAHAVEEEFSYFTLLLKGAHQGGSVSDDHGSVNSTQARSLFGIACTRQIKSDRLKLRSPDVTRSTVQKAVVVILENPGRLGEVRERLGAVTGAWFGQADFTNTDILQEFQESLSRDASKTDEQEHYIGRMCFITPMHDAEAIHRSFDKRDGLRVQTPDTGTVQSFIASEEDALLRITLRTTVLVTVCSDISDTKPHEESTGLCRSVLGFIREDDYKSGISEDKRKEFTFVLVDTSRTLTDQFVVLAYMGLPLQIFGSSSFFSPYTPLQLLDLLMSTSTHSFVVGSTNNLLLAQKDRYADILVNLDEESLSGKIQIINPALRNALSLTAADRRWIDNVTQTVLETWDPQNPGRPTTHGYNGSEDAIRLQFEEYLLSLCSSAAHKTYIDSQSTKTTPNTSTINTNTTNLAPNSTSTLSLSQTLSHETATPPMAQPTQDFNPDFLQLWRTTPNYILFSHLTLNASIFDIIPPRHPTAGSLSIEDVQRRLAQGVADLHLDERVREGREIAGRVLEGSKERVGAGVARFWKEVEGYRGRREASRGRSDDGSGSGRGDSRAKVDATMLKDNINGVDGTTSSLEKRPSTCSTSASATAAASAWLTTVRDRASKVQLQKPDVNVNELGTAARDNAAKAGAYLSSWGSWAKERSKEWSSSSGSGSGSGAAEKK